MTTARHTREPKHTTADAPTSSHWSHRATKVGVVALASVAIVAALGSPASAGSKGGGSTPTTNAVWFSAIDGVQLSATAKTPTPRLGDTLNFGSTVSGLAGWEYPMIAVSCYQDVNGDGVVDTSITGPDIVYSWLDKPSASYLLGAYSSIWTLRGGGDAVCRADLDAYGWKSGKQSVRVLATLGFDALG